VSGTLGNATKNTQARFSGRQRPVPKSLPPAKAGFIYLLQANPGRRFACPGLNSVAIFDGSLTAKF